MISKEHKETPEYIKSGYIYRLTSFVEWPTTVFNFSMSPFIIGIYGDHYIDIALFDTLRDRLIKDRDWKVEYIDSPKEIKHCHLLLITKIEKQDLTKLVQQITNRKILTVGDNIDQFCQMGGTINLVGNHPNYGYEINPKALKNAGLIIQKEFLDLATTID